MTFLAALKRVMNGGGMELDIIANPKLTDDGQAVIQVGCLLGNSENHTISDTLAARDRGRRSYQTLPQRPRHQRSPFAFPAREILLRSFAHQEQYILVAERSLAHERGQNVRQRPGDQAGGSFQEGASIVGIFISLNGAMHVQISDFQSRFKKIPNIIDLDHLTVTGDVHFGRGVTLRGTVIGRHPDPLCLFVD